MAPNRVYVTIKGIDVIDMLGLVTDMGIVPICTSIIVKYVVKGRITVDTTHVVIAGQLPTRIPSSANICV